ncbi:MAG: transglutaminase-like domain-containing protein [Pirellulaceae bacterium]|nr:transglutaminase-like domain-containing protein [Pirellulaceae bacterium]
MFRFGICAIVALSFFSLPTPGYAQFDQFNDTAESKSYGGMVLGEGFTQKLKVGVQVTARAGDIRGIVATIPIPSKWPEQTLSIVDEETTPHVKKIKYRDLEQGARQMIVTIDSLPRGKMAKAIVTFEITRHSSTAPEETDHLVLLKKKIPTNVRRALGKSPLIESTDRHIKKQAKEIIKDHENVWDQVEAIHTWVRENIEHKNEKLKGAAETLKSKTGNHEDLVSLFIALCRANKIPARTVWIPGGCYPEFYLAEEEEGNGAWYPCQITGGDGFGGIDERSPILQKGDNLKVPGEKKRFRFVPEKLTGAKLTAQNVPTVRFIRQVLPK